MDLLSPLDYPSGRIVDALVRGAPPGPVTVDQLLHTAKVLYRRSPEATDNPLLAFSCHQMADRAVAIARDPSAMALANKGHEHSLVLFQDAKPHKLVNAHLQDPKRPFDGQAFVEVAKQLGVANRTFLTAYAKRLWAIARSAEERAYNVSHPPQLVSETGSEKIGRSGGWREDRHSDVGRYTRNVVRSDDQAKRQPKAGRSARPKVP
ncbi:MAG: hypothetical protein H6729_16730 [Deltaproteobacteria bacterium]|nr:hypothetical protein [Deltaproteobacteria bacterium]